MLDELRATAPRIATYADWVREILELSDRALAADRRLPAAYHARTAQFFLAAVLDYFGLAGITPMPLRRA